jgi:hypothetical protein
MPCSADMMGRPMASSTALASAFIDTSSVAMPMPNTPSTTSNIQ